VNPYTAYDWLIWNEFFIKREELQHHACAHTQFTHISIKLQLNSSLVNYKCKKYKKPPAITLKTNENKIFSYYKPARTSLLKCADNGRVSRWRLNFENILKYIKVFNVLRS
jgi:hypothetical protein